MSLRITLLVLTFAFVGALVACQSQPGNPGDPGNAAAGGALPPKPAEKPVDPPQIPALHWQQRTDWISVRAPSSPPGPLQGPLPPGVAKGDGVTDDTAAIQTALDRVVSGTVIYFPPGTYRITGTLTLKPKQRSLGVFIVGHGRDSTILWDGPAGGDMWLDDSVTGSRYIGLTFDGNGKAGNGLHHRNGTSGFETEVGHRDMAFRNITDTAMLFDLQPATAETMTENCLFENCGRGMAFLAFNDYDYTIDGCEFRHCKVGVETHHGNAYVRNCHFEAGGTDLALYPEHGSTVRRCTSWGAHTFIAFYSSVAPLTVEDCQVGGWTSPEGAISIGGAPVDLFDCSFTSPPPAAAKAPVPGPAATPDSAGKAAPPPPPTPPLAAHVSRLFLSDNRPADVKLLVQDPAANHVYIIPAGKRHGSLSSPHQTFLDGGDPTPTATFDAKKDFGARGDGTGDDTVAIQSTINAARLKGDGAMAYLPMGNYIITHPLAIDGGNYSFGGTGVMTTLNWRGPDGGTILEVHNPDHITIEGLSVGTAGTQKNAIDILQTGGDRPSFVTYDDVAVFGMYQKQSEVKGLWLRGLGKDAVVTMPHVQGNIHFEDSARATIVAGNTYEGTLTVEGKDPHRDGLQGVITRLGTICTHAVYVKDNQNLIASDFYSEQSDNGYYFEGGAGDPPGRVTLQCPKMNMSVTKGAANLAFEIHDYAGQIFVGPEQFYGSPPPAQIVQTGTRPVEFFLWASSFYPGELEVKTDPTGRVFTLGCTREGGPRGSAPADATSPEVLAQLANALDDLRRLGEADLRVNHREVVIRK